MKLGELQAEILDAIKTDPEALNFDVECCYCNVTATDLNYSCVVENGICLPYNRFSIYVDVPDKNPNSVQIDRTSYYLLPCGKFLEDFIAYKRLNFAEGSALKYKWRAGHKDGESFEKDSSKMMHYVKSLVDETQSEKAVMKWIDELAEEAEHWSGKTEEEL